MSFDWIIEENAHCFFYKLGCSSYFNQKYLVTRNSTIFLCCHWLSSLAVKHVVMMLCGSCLKHQCVVFIVIIIISTII